MRPIPSRLALLALVATAALASWPQAAAAQVRYPGPWGPPYPYGPYRFGGPDADLKLDVAQKDAEVYVDGYLAGIVDDFDGVFQRLRLLPGPHEIVIYLDGHRSIRERLYLGPGMSRTIEGTMEPLAQGEANEPKPEPASPPDPPRDPAAPRRPPA